MNPSSPGDMQTVAVIIRQFEILSEVCSLVVFAAWQGLSYHIETILVGAPPRAGWWIKRIGTQTQFIAMECFFGS